MEPGSGTYGKKMQVGHLPGVLCCWLKLHKEPHRGDSLAHTAQLPADAGWLELRPTSTTTAQKAAITFRAGAEAIEWIGS
jgi:hypothetical protein